MAIAVMTSKGQLTVPKEIRDSLGLSAGSRLEFSPAGEGEWRLRAVHGHTLADLAGSVQYVGPALTVEQMDEAIAAAASERRRDDPEAGA
ncbi:MAG: AbrB/MazE/SpoVT family DNA-binding domain-containing protein [Dermatophilus congolensis]|nr:AbrB/MazE/SpoVT family DNA-binding domain-containing protein [Dermatophilus congolensis]